MDCGREKMRDVSAELKIFGGKTFIVFVFICLLVFIFDLDIKSAGFNNGSPFVELSKTYEKEKSKSIIKDIEAGNIENPSDRTLLLDDLERSVKESMLEESIMLLENSIRGLEAKIFIDELSKQLGLIEDNKNQIEGYIFIGDFDNNEWSKTMFAEEVKTPEDIYKGKILTLTSNLYLRAEMPTNSEDYYRTIKSLKILPKGTRVLVLDKPVGIKREHATQWWVHVL